MIPGGLQAVQDLLEAEVVRLAGERHQRTGRQPGCVRWGQQRPAYAEAKAALLRCRRELGLLNASAVTSLAEGLEETLTLHRLGVFRELGISLKTTNCLESLNSLVGQRVARVDRWRTSDQKQHWLAAALLAIEPGLRRIKGFRALPLLRAAVERALHQEEGIVLTAQVA